jgi:hypothetical protein
LGSPGSGAAPGETALFEVVVQVNPATPHYTTISGTASAYSIDSGTTDLFSFNSAMTVTTKAMVVADPLEPNDTPATASVLPLGTTSDLIYSANGAAMDTDWYKFFVTPEEAGKDLKVNLRVTSAYPDPIPPGWRTDVDFDVLDGSLNDLAAAVSASDNETIYIPGAASGWYYINLLYSEANYPDCSGCARYAITIETGTAAGFGIGYVTGRAMLEGGIGIEKVRVQANAYPYDWSVSFVTATTGPGGYFTVAAAPGQHYLYFTGDPNVSPNNPEVNIVPEYYLDKAARADADPVSVSVGQTLNVGDINVATGAIVSGQVTNQSASPLANATVLSYDSAGNQQSYAFTDTGGNYLLERVPTGGARIRFSRSNYATEFYNDKPSYGSGSVLPTLAGGTIPGINAQLTPGGIISGTVKNAQGAGMVATVYLYSVLDGTFARTSTTSAAGTGAFSFARAMPGNYKIFVVPAGENYPAERYSNAPSFTQASVVLVTEGMNPPGVDVVLGAVNGADFTGDLKSDILWRHASLGDVWLWPMNGSTPLGEIYVGTVSTAYDIVGAADYSLDGKADLIWRQSSTGELWVWIMNGAETLDEFYVATVDPGYQVAGAADVDGDGIADDVWWHGTTGEVWLWLIDDLGEAAQHHVGSVTDTGYRIKCVADFTGDGKADILWHHATRGEVWMWPMNGATRVSEAWIATVPDVGYQIVK